MNVIPIGQGRKKPLHKRNKSLSRERLVEMVKVFPPTSERLTRVHFVWPCFNCHAMLSVNRDTFQQLESRVLLGLKCSTCLEPPPNNNWLRVA